MKYAKNNIKENPQIYLINLFTNPLKLLFNFPKSYKYQSLEMYWYLFPHFSMLFGLLLSIYPAWINKNNIPIKLIILGIFFSIYFLGSCLVFAYARFLLTMIPFVILWIAYIISNYYQIKIIKKHNY